MNQPISITALSSISPLGKTLEETWQHYLNKNHCFVEKNFNGNEALVASLSSKSHAEIEALRQSDSKYKSLDDTVLFAIYTSRKAVKKANWKVSDNFGINIGSSRGATSLFEKYYKDFLKRGKSKTLSSPTTTLGNISSWVAHDLQTKGPEISHSITCSTALHALLNGVVWLQAGMSDKFLVGGSEAPLTAFTIAQMQALKIYAKNNLSGRAESRPFDIANLEHSRKTQGDSIGYPCLALDLSKKRNSMILGEGASIACLEKGNKKNALAFVEGIGYATELLEHNTSLSTEANCFQDSMKMALGDLAPEEVDIIVTHTPGTIKGDLAEYRAIEKVFCNKIPFLTTNKWKLGHTFGASGLLSLELAILMLQHQEVVEVPYNKTQNQPTIIQKVLVNAVGFGGNAVSVLLSK